MVFQRQPVELEARLLPVQRAWHGTSEGRSARLEDSCLLFNAPNQDCLFFSLHLHTAAG